MMTLHRTWQSNTKWVIAKMSLRWMENSFPNTQNASYISYEKRWDDKNFIVFPTSETSMNNA